MGAPERIENPKEEWNVEKRGVEGNGKILKKKGYKRQGLKAGRKDRSERGRGRKEKQGGIQKLERDFDWGDRTETPVYGTQLFFSLVWTSSAMVLTSSTLTLLSGSYSLSLRISSTTSRSTPRTVV